jgi:Spy/CpxP family protein refolding chaperone
MVSKLGSTRTLIGACVALAAVALVSAALVFAQAQSSSSGQAGPGMRGMGPMGGMRGRGPMGPMGMMGRGGLMGLRMELRQLDLTDTQKEQVTKILESHKGEGQSLAKETGPAREALHTAIENNDESAIQTAGTALASEIVKGALLGAKVHAEVFSVLTDKQKAKAKELRARPGQRGGRFPGMHQGPPLF